MSLQRIMSYVSREGRKLIEGFEGLVLHAYQDSVGVWTIGYGHTNAAGGFHFTPATGITQIQADDIFNEDLRQWENVVNRVLQRNPTQHQFDALVSLCHNIGSRGFVGSSVVRAFNQGRINDAADDFLMWEHPHVLKARREKERAYFLTHD